MKQEFINFLNALMEAAPQVEMSESVKAYIEALMSDDVSDKPVLTDNGKIILKYIQENPSAAYKSKDIADGLFISSRTVSGAMRKLVNDGFLEKVSKDPVIYAITEKGKNFKIED